MFAIVIVICRHLTSKVGEFGWFVVWLEPSFQAFSFW